MHILGLTGHMVYDTDTLASPGDSSLGQGWLSSNRTLSMDMEICV